MGDRGDRSERRGWEFFESNKQVEQLKRDLLKSWVVGAGPGVQERRRETERRERPGCLGGPDGRNETQIAIIYFRRPVITEPESLRTTEFLLGSKPHAAEVNIRNVKKGFNRCQRGPQTEMGSSFCRNPVLILNLCEVVLPGVLRRWLRVKTPKNQRRTTLIRKKM